MSANSITRQQARYQFKSAATRGIKELRRILGTDRPLGEVLMDPAALAKVEQELGPDALQKIMAGRDVAEVGRALGAGNEGIAYPALGRQGHGVLKIHDPTANLYAPNVIDAKRNFVGHTNPNLAQIHYEVGPGKINGMAAPAFMHEYVPGVQLTDVPGGGADARKLEDAVRNYEHKGHGVLDVGRHNLKVTPEGQVKAVDFMAAPIDALKPGGPRAGYLNVAFKEGIRDPYFQQMNDLRRVRPEKLENVAAREGVSYADYALRNREKVPVAAPAAPTVAERLQARRAAGVPSPAAELQARRAAAAAAAAAAAPHIPATPAAAPHIPAAPAAAPHIPAAPAAAPHLPASGVRAGAPAAAAPGGSRLGRNVLLGLGALGLGYGAYRGGKYLYDNAQANDGRGTAKAAAIRKVATETVLNHYGLV
jgi:hypothetical protein